MKNAAYASDRSSESPNWMNHGSQLEIRSFGPQAEQTKAGTGGIDLLKGPVFAGGMPVRAKLTIGEPDDQYEQEADRVAEQVMNTPDSAVQQSVQRDVADDQTSVEEVQEPSELEHKLSSSSGNGSPLPDEVCQFMGQRFGTNFDHVRVHTGNDAVQMNRGLQAQAFTHGSHIYYGAGKKPAKDSLTAHELTHVVQQTGTEAALSAPLSLQRSFWTGDNLKDDFWGTKQLLGNRWGGTADAAIASAWDVAGVIPGIGSASGLVGAGIDGVKSLASSGMGAYHAATGNLDAADQDVAASERFIKDIVVDGVSAIPGWGTGQSGASLLWDGASVVDRAMGNPQAPLSGDIFAEELWR
jgi:hypothetical protein